MMPRFQAGEERNKFFTSSVLNKVAVSEEFRMRLRRRA